LLLNTDPRLEPVNELDDVWVLQSLQHVELVVNHLLVAFDVLLQNDLDGDLAGRALGLTNDAIGTSAEGATEPVFSPIAIVSSENVSAVRP
jgi:hypothetical protein